MMLIHFSIYSFNISIANLVVIFSIGTSVWRSSWSGGRLATTFVATYLEKVDGSAQNLGVDRFPDPSAILGLLGGYFGFYKQCSITDSERVPLGSYSVMKRE